MAVETLDKLAARIFEVLKVRAAKRELIFYYELMIALGFKNGDKRWFKRMNDGLIRLGEFCNEEPAGPLFPALVVKRGKDVRADMPGDGFFTQARRMGRLVGPDERAFWEEECDKCFDLIKREGIE